VLRSLAAPAPDLIADPAALRDRVGAAAGGLLGLLGLSADPIQSREHIFLSNLLDRAWREGRNLDLAALIQQVQKPPFDKLGVFDLESFYPAKDRFTLAMQLNNLLASPGFSAWLDGDPLDIQRLLYTPDGRPRMAILSIAHLSPEERMFFVTLLLNELLAWMRTQPGTSSLRALLYMDEIFGFFPPTAVPPSKTVMLTLLKQARAYGVGIVLATQNPVDLDYKGLSNAGTWFIGRLQTERDKARVLEGLESASAAAGGAFDRGAAEALISGLGKRVFLMRNVHEETPVLFQTRWTLSYLRGPMTLPQIRAAAAALGAPPAATAQPAAAPPQVVTMPPAAAPAPAAARPNVPAGVDEFFLQPASPGPACVYRPAVAGIAKLHFVDSSTDIDTWETAVLVAPFAGDGSGPDWSQAERLAGGPASLSRQPDAVTAAGFDELPSQAGRPQSYAVWRKELASHLYQNITLDLQSCPALKMVSTPGESSGDFAVRVAQKRREQRDAQVDALRRKYDPKVVSLQDQVRRADERVAREQGQYGQQKVQAAISIGAAVLGAFLGRRAVSVGSVGRSTTAARGVSRIGREKEDVERASDNLGVLQERLQALQAELDAAIAALQGEAAPGATDVQAVRIRPRKSDISVTDFGLLWRP
jgi:hypothetical protein